VLNFATLKELWFTARSGGRGRALVELKDMCQSSKRVFHRLFARFCSDPGAGMVLSEFQAFVRASGTDLDPDASKAQFFEAAGYPDDEDDAAQVAAIRATPGVFTTAVVRVANAYVMQEFGESEKTLCEQLSDWFVACKDKLGIEDTDLADIATSGVRDPSFFEPPPAFAGTRPRVFLQLSGGSDGGGGGGRVVIELNGEAAPKAAYNFQALCTGERGVGELTGLPLTLKGCSFHRLVAGMCLQGGDIEGNDGYGGESVYGGEFEDSAFTLKHEEAGVVSCGNAGPNTNTSQFFFTLAAAPHLDGENVAFGKVVEGLDVVLALGNSAVNDEEVPTPAILVEDCGLA
jgi:cyclophilin family peptidyl-prolyl cis-trans isomerase